MSNVTRNDYGGTLVFCSICICVFMVFGNTSLLNSPLVMAILQAQIDIYYIVKVCCDFLCWISTESLVCFCHPIVCMLIFYIVI